MHGTGYRTLAALGLALALLVAACGGAGPTPTPPPPTAGPTTAATSAPVATNPSTGEPALTAAAEVLGGTELEVSWTGPNALGDYVTIVKVGTTEWTTEDYFNTNGSASPQKLLAPTEAGAYELWYVSGADKQVLVRRAIAVLPVTASLTAPDSVEANKEFEVAFTGPVGPGDFITIVKLGATQWTNEDYFNAIDGSPSKLLAPIEAGAYELWYVTGSAKKTPARRPITVTATSATLQAPADVARGAQFQVTWTGPNGPGDYVTIVPVGSTPSTYLSYSNTTSGSPAILTAPEEAGNYEVWYVAGQGPTVLARDPIKVN